MKHKVAFFDMDGTVYKTEADIISQSTLTAIDLLKSAGYKVVAATGRPLNLMKNILEQVQFDYYVLINGGYVLDKNFKVIETSPLADEDVEALVALADDSNLGLMMHFGDATYIYNDFYPMYYFSKYANSLESLFYDPNKAFHQRHPVYNSVILTKNPDVVQNFIESHPSLRLDLINIKTDGFAYDIFNAGTDKANGVQTVLDALGYDWSDAIAFGDSTNDIKMLEKAGIGVAMGQANDYVKSFADLTTQDIDHHGIYNAVKKILSEE